MATIESPLPASCFAGTINAYVHEHDVPPGAPPSTIIRTDQDWSVHISWQTTGVCTGMITGKWHLHCYLESMGPGPDYDLIDPADHKIPLTPGPSPIPYKAHFDVKKGKVAPGLYRLVASLTYVEPTGSPGPMAGFVEGPMLQVYTP